MLYKFCVGILLFLVYSFIGYLVEITCCSLNDKKLVLNRGYLIGPCIPIYGFGAIMIILLLDKYKNDLLVLFVMSVLICTVIEYLTSLIMEKIFKLRWWDYSKEKFNVNGRICLTDSVLFGFGGVLIIKLINSYILNIFYNMPHILLIILTIILFCIFITDVIESTYISFKLKINVSKYVNKDATKEIKRQMMKKLHSNKTLIIRLINAFPDLTYVRNNKKK